MLHYTTSYHVSDSNRIHALFYITPCYSRLNHIRLNHVHHIYILCAGLSGCTALQSLKLFECRNLTDVPGMVQLRACARMYVRTVWSGVWHYTWHGAHAHTHIHSCKCSENSETFINTMSAPLCAALSGCTLLQSINLNRCSSLTSLTGIAQLHACTRICTQCRGSSDMHICVSSDYYYYPTQHAPASSLPSFVQRSLAALRCRRSHSSAARA